MTTTGVDSTQIDSTRLDLTRILKSRSNSEEGSGKSRNEIVHKRAIGLNYNMTNRLNSTRIDCIG